MRCFSSSRGRAVPPSRQPACMLLRLQPTRLVLQLYLLLLLGIKVLERKRIRKSSGGKASAHSVPAASAWLPGGSQSRRRGSGPGPSQATRGQRTSDCVRCTRSARRSSYSCSTPANLANSAVSWSGGTGGGGRSGPSGRGAAKAVAGGTRQLLAGGWDAPSAGRQEPAGCRLGGPRAPGAAHLFGGQHLGPVHDVHDVIGCRAGEGGGGGLLAGSAAT